MTIKTEHFIPAELADWQTPVLDKDLTTAPESPNDGDRYVIAGTGGDWSAATIKDIAWYIGSTWYFITPTSGMQVYVVDEGLYYFYNGSTWGTLSGSGDMTKSVYDTDEDGIVDKAENVDDGAGNSATAIQVKANVTHTNGDGSDHENVAANTTQTAKNKDNIIINAFRIAINGSLSQFNMIDGIVDEYEDETGIDTSSSSNETYDSADDYYEPTGSARTYTANSNAQLDTAQKKFGTASLLCNSSSDNINTTDVSPFNVGTNNWTMDCWYRPNSYSSGSDTHTFMWLENSSNTRVLAIYKSSGTLTVETEYGTSSSKAFSTTTSTGTWYHIAVVRSGNDLKVFVDGTQVGSTQDASNFDISTATKLYIGSFFNGGNYLDGWFDEFRFSDTARWTSNFTAPSSEYTADSNTITLLHFNGSDASTTITDSVSASVYNMTLISDSFTAEAEPDSARIVILEEDVDSVTLNTDLKAYASRDGGSTWAQITLSDEGDFDNNKRVLVGDADLDVSAIGSGTSMEYKIETANNKNLKIHATALSWD